MFGFGSIEILIIVAVLVGAVALVAAIATIIVLLARRHR